MSLHFLSLCRYTSCCAYVVLFMKIVVLVTLHGCYVQNYTQNIDTLESQAGVQRVLQCHGSFATASCLNCRIRVPGFEIEDDILSHRVPLCKVCNLEPNRASSKVDSKQKSKKRRGSGWNSDESDEPDRPEFPPGIMKASFILQGCRTFVMEHLYAPLVSAYSPTSLSSVKS